MSRDKIKELIEEMQKPGADKHGLANEILKIKKELGDAVPTDSIPASSAAPAPKSSKRKSSKK